MRSRALSMIVVLGLAGLGCRDVRSAESHAKESPFQEVRMAGEEAEVLVDGAWYRLVALDGIPAARILEHSRKQYAQIWEKRFAEDLVEVLSGMGHATGKAVTLELRHADGRIVTIKDVPMTRQNRELVRRARQALGTQRVSRPHAATLDPALAPLVTRVERTLPAHAVADDLDQLEWILDNLHSYSSLRGVDYRASLDAIRVGAAAGISTDAFGFQIARAIAPLGDAHSRVAGLRSRMPWGSLPLRFVEVDGQVVALGPNGLLADAAHPHVASIDGRPLDEWLHAAATIVPAASPRFVRQRAIELLPRVGAWRAVMGVPPSREAAVTLRGEGSSTRELQFQLVDEPPRARERPDSHRILDGGVGYVRLSRMSDDPDVARAFDAALSDLDDTRGLIIDVRDNPGGSRRLTLVTAADLLRRGDGLRVGNVAAVRRPPQAAPLPEGQLDDRFAYPLTHPRWDEADKAALTRFAKDFRPEWQPPPGQFSEWHYFAVQGGRDTPRHPGPIAILMDGGCFSATDIFLSTLKGAPGVTLVGTASGGGSGRPQEHQLERSRIEVTLSTMVSLGPDGRLYEGEGTQPDVVVEPTLSDVQGLTDTQLDAARRLLEQAAATTG